MKSSKTRQLAAAFLIVIMLNLTFLPLTRVAAQIGDLKVKVKIDPANPKRKIIELPPLQQQARVIRLKQNILDLPQFRRPAIPFKKFEMVSSTGKPLDPNRIINLPGRHTITVKQFYDESNLVEESLNKSGYSLRSADTFDNIKLSIVPRAVSSAMIPKGARKISQGEFNSLKSSITTAASKTSSITAAGKFNSRVVKTVSSISGGKLFASGNGIIKGPTEFPPNWKSTSVDCNNSNCHLLIKFPKGSEQNYGKLVWQVSEVPFASSDNPLQDANVIKVGIMKTDWSFSTGWNFQDDVKSQGDPDKFSYMQFDIDFATFAPKKDAKYYVRAVLTDQNNSAPAVTSSLPLDVIMSGGAGEIEIPQTHNSDIHNQPNNNFPGDDSPFGFYFHKNTLSGKKFSYQGKTGYKIEGGAELGVRYYNFEHLTNSNKAVSNEQPLLGGRFEAVSGTGTGANNANETQGARLIISIAGQETSIPLTNQEAIPTGEYSLDYKDGQKIDQQLIKIVIPLLPVVSIVVEAKITGEYGYQLSGKINFMDNSAAGNLRLYVKTDFNSKADLEFPLGIAYVGMKGTSLPLFNAEINSSFSSAGNGTVMQIGSYQALVIDVSLNAGFYHPCPPVKQIKKFWGYITGDEDTPLCKTEWNYNILENKKGFEDAWIIDG